MPGMTDRDHFAAAALTGLLAQGDDGSFSEEFYARAAYRWADAMLRERAKTNYDAAPEAIASVDSVAPQPTTRGESDRNDKAAPRPSEGTGDTPKPISGCVSDRPKPITGPDPDSRVWETPVHTPATHATRGEGSVRREGTEPFAWAIEVSEGVWSFTHMPHVAKRWPQEVFVPLYRQPQPTLTDAERRAVEAACNFYSHECETDKATDDDYQNAATLRGLLERLGGER